MWKSFLKFISDPFQDKQNYWDEKRIWGSAFLLIGLLYAIGIFGKPDNGIFITLVGTGTGLLGLAIAGDVNNPKGPFGPGGPGNGAGV